MFQNSILRSVLLQFWMFKRVVLAVSAIISPAALIWHLWPEHFQIQCCFMAVKVGKAKPTARGSTKVRSSGVNTALVLFYHSICDPNIKHEYFFHHTDVRLPYWTHVTVLCIVSSVVGRIHKDESMTIK